MHKSILRTFHRQLIVATTLFIILLSLIFYGFTKATIYEDLKEELIQDAQLIYRMSVTSTLSSNEYKIIANKDAEVDIVTVEGLDQLAFRQYKKEQHNYIEILYPLNKKAKQFIKISKSTASADKMLNKIFNNLLLISIGGFIMILIYTLALSRTLLHPILQITRNLSKMNENFLTQINPKLLPEEFHPLAVSINQLTNKIQHHITYQKELFIGAAHELKTPLAVIKLKSEITLRKKRDCENYEETLKLTIDSVNDMNTMISSILDMGRQEGAKFETPMQIEVLSFLANKCNDYKMLAEQKNVNLVLECSDKKFFTSIQPTLLIHIVQNIIQNAIKFTESGKTIKAESFVDEEGLKINIIDEGPGIDESVDLFAPFKRLGGKPGAGLGLFLAKSAADTLGAEISIKNRTDGVQGTIASVFVRRNPFCEI